jgi:arginine repressor
MPRRKKAAPAEQPTKAQMIRDVANSLGKKVRPRDVIAKLAEQGVKVTSPQVSKTLRDAGYRRKRRGRKAAPAKVASNSHNSLNIDALLAAKALIIKVGSVEAAEEAIRVLKKLG